ncbi:DNA mismatch repair protein MutS [Breznakiella homolactica]|uniref:DNA mismatch repair protein MutS n=1 Tax=Breznakiella homolactica TaxID=2798577 RepID=A0A7T7XKX8_9SPIR|nr:DNA mismatch repair protein MutS [Breznakiella homolactica]QQO08200.1 DNA mismatch repair protein MutS [Breznakiella homolactica]
MLEQYRRIKRDHQGEVLFFRLGDFYEMFAEDAVEISALLNLTLTSRNGQPMCGIPYHAARSYIARLLKYGKKIAVCEQVSEPGKGKGIVDRKVVEVITPGTTVDEDYLDKGNPNYLCALASGAKGLSFAYIDLSTGEFRATSFPFDGAAERIRQELERLQAKEMLVQESLLEEYPAVAAAVSERPSLVINRWADWLFDPQRSREGLEKQFGTASLKGFGFEDHDTEILAAGALLDYLDGTARSLLPHVRTLIRYGEEEFVGIDESSQRNLELIRNLRDGDVRFSLLETMDETKTAMGRRLLKQRLLHPLRDLALIARRLDMVETFYRDQGRLSALRDLLAKTPDLQRLCSRLAMDKAHGKDMVAVKNSLLSFEAVETLTGDLSLAFENTAGSLLDAGASGKLSSIRDLLEKGLCDDPSILLSEGNLIRDGYNRTLDDLKTLRDNGRGLLEQYLEEERAATGISTLKIRYNRLIGYFFEVTKMHLSKVPSHFIRRQGVAGGERYTTDRLASLESEINGASDKIVELEKNLFLELREAAKALIPELTAAAARLSELDVAQSLARAATVRLWVRPGVDGENRTAITEGRHPVVEAHLPRGEFIPNDVLLDGGGISFALITGPNMAGKSTYLRQAALITIMAQCGSFVPAKEAHIGLTDRIYCRVGASDNLARGESTFLVEMNETAHILHTATSRSLVIMDEVGRGTGTSDGLSIAWAVSEELLETIGCRTLFATHYHELSLISHPRMANRSMEVLERNGEIVFLRRLIEGAAAESYGLHVASLAGIPDPVLRRAQRIMDRLREKEQSLHEELFLQEKTAPQNPSAAVVPEELERILEDIRSLNPDRMTPLEALNRIHTWKSLVKGYTSKYRTHSKNDPPDLFESQV